MSIRWNDEVSLEVNLRKRLRRLAEKYFAEGNSALHKKAHWKELHKFRLATKRFRYTLELFEPVYGQPLRARLEELKKIQDYLGEANDSMTTRALLKDLEGMAELRRSLKSDAGECIARADKFWRNTFDKNNVRKIWLDYFDSEF